MRDYKKLDETLRFQYKEDWLEAANKDGYEYISEWLISMVNMKRREIAKKAGVTAETITHKFQAMGVPTPLKIARRSKLTPADVLYIRRVCKETNISHYKLAKKMGVKQPTICNIVKRVTWKDI